MRDDAGLQSGRCVANGGPARAILHAHVANLSGAHAD